MNEILTYKIMFDVVTGHSPPSYGWTSATSHSDESSGRICYPALGVSDTTSLGAPDGCRGGVDDGFQQEENDRRLIAGALTRKKDRAARFHKTNIDDLADPADPPICRQLQPASKSRISRVKGHGLRGGRYVKLASQCDLGEWLTASMPGVTARRYDELLAQVRIDFVAELASVSTKKRFYRNVAVTISECFVADEALPASVVEKLLARVWYDWSTKPSYSEFTQMEMLEPDAQMGYWTRTAAVQQRVDNTRRWYQRAGTWLSLGLWKPAQPSFVLE